MSSFHGVGIEEFLYSEGHILLGRRERGGGSGRKILVSVSQEMNQNSLVTKLAMFPSLLTRNAHQH